MSLALARHPSAAPAPAACGGANSPEGPPPAGRPRAGRTCARPWVWRLRGRGRHVGLSRRSSVRSNGHRAWISEIGPAGKGGRMILTVRRCAFAAFEGLCWKGAPIKRRLDLPHGRAYGTSRPSTRTLASARPCCGSSVVEHSIGNGEVESSILSRSTISTTVIPAPPPARALGARKSVKDFINRFPSYKK